MTGDRQQATGGRRQATGGRIQETGGRIQEIGGRIQEIGISIARIVLGLTFIFSGFVKAVDPLGTTYKIEDYLMAMGPALEWVMPAAYFMAIALIIVELCLGVMMLLNLRPKVASIGMLAFMIAVTPLTLWIALTNPVSDCGCFGDAIVLTNWQTFWKNIVLFILVLLVLFFNKRQPRLSARIQWCIIFLVAILTGAFMSYTRLHLPIIDFRPYKIGNNIPELMEIPEGAEMDQYDIRLVYADADGKEKEFTINNYPKDDNWHFVRQNSKLIKEGYRPPIHDFEILNMDYEDITQDILESDVPVTIVVMYDLDKTDIKQMEKVTQLYYQCLRERQPFYIFTGASDARIEEFCYHVEEVYNTLNGCASDRLTPFNHWENVFCTADPVMLKTIVRANPGVFVIQDGNIIDKYNIRNK